MEQVTRGSRGDMGEGIVLLAVMAVGALQRGWVAVVHCKGGVGGGSAHGGGHACERHG
jgi:hypothetical protein